MENKFKFIQIQDPENCSIEELEKEVTRIETLGNFFETKQLALKKFLNSKNEIPENKNNIKNIKPIV